MAERLGCGRSRAFAALAVAALAALAACTVPQREVSPHAVSNERAAPPVDAADAYYREAIARGSAVYRVDPARSLAVIEVRRGGALARLGHDHVVSSRDISGY